MDSTQFIPICKRLALLIKHKYKLFNLQDEYGDNQNFGENGQTFIEGLNDKANKIEMTLVRKDLAPDEFTAYLLEANHPVLAFLQTSTLIPVVLLRDEKEENITVYSYHGKEEKKTKVQPDQLDHLAKNEEGQIFFSVPLSMHPLVSSDDNLTTRVVGPVSRLFRLFESESKDFVLIMFYGVLISVISLALPVGIQAVIELISAGVVFNSIILLISLVLIATLVVGVLQVMQRSMVEFLQRRLFAKAAFEMSFRLPRVKMESLVGESAPELMNRFFDVLTIQKGLPKLLMEMTGAALQIIFGLMLLSFYHPTFILLTVFLISGVIILLLFTGPQGLRAKLITSKYKYKVVHWLEEVARTLYVFKLAGHSNLSVERMDNFVNNYLFYRKKYFSKIIQQFFSVVLFRTLITGGLLVVGSWLVIERKITLGQFVATEIIIILVLNALEKLVAGADTVYDMLTAVEKIGQVTDLPLEKRGGVSLPKGDVNGAFYEISNLNYKYPNSKSYVLKDINLSIKSGERISVAGYNGAGKNTLAKVLSGMVDSFEGNIIINNTSVRDINLSHLRDNVSKNVVEDNVFDGTIMENISMGRTRVSYQDVIWALECVDLDKYVNALPKGLLSQMLATEKRHSAGVAKRITLARSIAERPQMLILNDIFQDMCKHDKLKVLGKIMDRENPWTMMCITNDPLIFSLSDRILFMQDGKIVGQGSYEEMLQNPIFREAQSEWVLQNTEKNTQFKPQSNN
ncbi:peptidase domain-containing ABC transporter [Sediminitomix flava]|uniref:ABC-type bacteriocin/lantibiotic exporter with double-glycine peptidase domain n=1 Tax=Sediminitomix flava TaxID=379075 RepID=A0A315ZHM3_SEDFL|nr:ABC transporter ATP-binding protein [Sediminitomix flava]PWJ44792.1 ABC-type bacteriocin/lantibiotic exporter with double-glycine peptidase domain [Sediminitomix flava]